MLNANFHAASEEPTSSYSVYKDQRVTVLDLVLKSEKRKKVEQAKTHHLAERVTRRVARRTWGVDMGSLATRPLTRAAPEHPACAAWPLQHARATKCLRGAAEGQPQQRPRVRVTPERPTPPEHPAGAVGPMRLRQSNLGKQPFHGRQHRLLLHRPENKAGKD